MPSSVGIDKIEELIILGRVLLPHSGPSAWCNRDNALISAGKQATGEINGHPQELDSFVKLKLSNN